MSLGDPMNAFLSSEHLVVELLGHRALDTENCFPKWLYQFYTAMHEDTSACTFLPDRVCLSFPFSAF